MMRDEYMREKERREKTNKQAITSCTSNMHIKHKSAMYIFLIMIIEMDIGFLDAIIVSIHAT